jgi:chemotaxis protein methyltransferase CheR
MSDIISQDIKQYSESFYRLIDKHTGICLDASKDYLVASRLAPIAKRHGFTHYEMLLKHLFLIPLGEVHWECFEAMTINETMFFRDIHPFETIKNHILPKIIQKNQTKKSLNIWCAAASTGQEPYSLSMLIKDTFPELDSWKVFILATDICDLALKKAMNGIYNVTEMSRGLSPIQIEKNFTKLENGSWQINSDVKKNIVFQRQNLVEEWSIQPKFDLILLRNVLIYFKPDTKIIVFNKLFDQFADDDSYLLLGSSEFILYENKYTMLKHDRMTYYHRTKV